MRYRAATGSVSQTREAFGSRVRYRFLWISDGAGDALARVAFDMSGETAEEVEFCHTSNGSETYAVTLIDDVDMDWLAGLGSGKATNTTTRAALVEVTVSSAESRPAPLPSGLWFKVDCSASAERSGSVDIWTRVR